MSPIQGPLALPSILGPKPVRAVNTPGKADPDWDTKVQGKPRFAKIPLHRSERAPLGTAKPFLPSSFASREAEYEFLVSTQDVDLPTVGQELAEIGLASFSLNQPDPTTEVSPEISEAELEHAACRYGTAYEIPDPDLMRRIEWERFVSQCSTVTTIRTVATTTGRTLQVLDRRWSKEMIADYAPHFVEAFGGQLAPQEELEGAREHIAHFRLRAIDFADPDARDSWFANNGAKHAYLNFADDNVARERAAEAPPAADGPKEIGFHGTTVPTDLGPDWKGRVSYDPNEPAELALWPLTPAERAYVERHGALPPVEAYIARTNREYVQSLRFSEGVQPS